MNNKAKTILRNMRYAISANLFVLLISVVLNIFVPRFVGVREYGFWQLYVFYSSYVGFLHFGWLDGIYLKIGGENYATLNKKVIGSQFYYLIIFEFVISIIMILFGISFVSPKYKVAILFFTAINSLITNCRTFILYILQSTNKIKEYAHISKDDKYIYIVLLITYIFLGGNSFIIMIILDLVSKTIITGFGILRIRDLLKIRIYRLNVIKSEILDNLKIGSNLMIGNIAGLLIIGVCRFFVERRWSIETFAKLSLVLSVSNMFLTFINAIGIVLYPLLRRTPKYELSTLYKNIRNVFVPLTFLLLIFYEPIKFVLANWLPDYRESLTLMGILFPIVIYESRMALLISTYLKTMRKEKTILVINVASLLVSLVLSFLSVYVYSNLMLTVLSIMFTMGFRSVTAEIYIFHILGIRDIVNVAIETIITVIFIFINILGLKSIIGFTIYLIIYVIYLTIRRKKILESSRYLINKLK